MESHAAGYKKADPIRRSRLTKGLESVVVLLIKGPEAKPGHGGRR